MLGSRGEEIRNRFIARTVSLDQRLAALIDGLGRPHSDVAITEIRALGHSLAGAAGTFGFPDLSALAGSVEAEADRMRKEGSTEIELLRVASNRLLDAIRNLAVEGQQPS